MQLSNVEEELNQLVKKVAWGVQYRVKKQERQSYSHLPYLDEFCGSSVSDLNAVEEQLYIDQILSVLPERARFIIKRLVIDRATESEVAAQLNVSRETVHYYRKKYLAKLKNVLSA